MSRHNHTKSWRQRQVYIRERQRTERVAERLGAGTNELYVCGSTFCPLCMSTMDYSKTLKPGDLSSPRIAVHPDNPTCPNSGKGWVLPRTRCQPVPQAVLDEIIAKAGDLGYSNNAPKAPRMTLRFPSIPPILVDSDAPMTPSGGYYAHTYAYGKGIKP